MIPSQIPVQLTNRPGLLQALALKPGQLFEAVVTGTNAAGVTEVLVGKQSLALTLQAVLAPGTTLQMKVETANGAPRFVVTGQTPPAEQAEPGTGAQQPLPQTQSQPQVPTAQVATAGRSTVQQQAGAPQPEPSSPQQSSAQSQPQAPVAREQATIVMREAALPDRPAQALAQSLRPGQVVEARVLGPTPSGATEVTVGKQQIALPLPNNPPAGTMLQLRADATPVGPRLVVVTQTPPQAAGQPALQPQGQPQTQSGGTAPASTPQTPVAAQSLPGGGAAADLVRTATPQVAITQTVATRVQNSPQPVASQPMPQTEQAAVAQMVQVSAGRQDTTTALMTGLQDVAKSRMPLPAPVAQAAAQVLAARTELSGPTLTGATLQKAVLASGVFQESLLAQGDNPGAKQGDVKSALLSLRSALVNWLGQDGAAVLPHLQRQPPVRGGTPRAPKEAVDPLPLTDGPEEVGKALLDRTEGALARVRLHQHASLPDQAARANAEWHLELPVTVNQQQTVLQMQVSRDGGGGGGAASDGERSWQMRFAIDLKTQGEVGAQVGLRGKKASVMLWAAEDGTAQQIRELLPQLARDLAAGGLELGSINVRSGTPAAPAQAASGGLVDALR